jgi:hypothetical protein
MIVKQTTNQMTTNIKADNRPPDGYVIKVADIKVADRLPGGQVFGERSKPKTMGAEHALAKPKRPMSVTPTTAAKRRRTGTRASRPPLCAIAPKKFELNAKTGW